MMAKNSNKLQAQINCKSQITIIIIILTTTTTTTIIIIIIIPTQT